MACKPRDWDGEIYKAKAGRTGIVLFVQRAGGLFYWRAWPVIQAYRPLTAATIEEAQVEALKCLRTWVRHCQLQLEEIADVSYPM